MKITIDLNDESFEDYFEEKDGTLDFTSAAIDMIIRTFAEKCRWDDEIRNYIKGEIKDGLWKKITEYKDSDAIKVIASETIQKEMRPSFTGSILITDRTKEKVREYVKETIADEEMRIVNNVRGLIRIEARRVLDTAFKDSAIREFIDKPKLTNYIMSSLNKEDTENADNHEN